jgi:hypothetical protein
MFGDYVEEQGNDVQTQSCAFLVSVYLRLSKKRVTLFISSSVLSCTSGPRYDVMKSNAARIYQSLPTSGLRHCLTDTSRFSLSQLSFQRCSLSPSPSVHSNNWRTPNSILSVILNSYVSLKKIYGPVPMSVKTWHETQHFAWWPVCVCALMLTVCAGHLLGRNMFRTNVIEKCGTSVPNTYCKVTDFWDNWRDGNSPVQNTTLCVIYCRACV